MYTGVPVLRTHVSVLHPKTLSNNVHFFILVQKVKSISIALGKKAKLERESINFNSEEIFMQI